MKYFISLKPKTAKEYFGTKSITRSIPGILFRSRKQKDTFVNEKYQKIIRNISHGTWLGNILKLA